MIILKTKNNLNGLLTTFCDNTDCEMKTRHFHILLSQNEDCFTYFTRFPDLNISISFVEAVNVID